VFLLPPLFILGIALGLLALRSGSLLPGIILHASCYTLLQLGPALAGSGAAQASSRQLLITAICTTFAASLLWWQNRAGGAGPVAAILAVPQPAGRQK
jgi:membrane protease YdiL (CAAX protease family)